MPANLGNGCHSSFEWVLDFVMGDLKGTRPLRPCEGATTGGGGGGGSLVVLVVFNLGDVEEGGVGG